MRSISASSSKLDESFDELGDWVLLEDEFASGGLLAVIHATMRHPCKIKSSGKMQFCNRPFVISGVHSLPTPTKMIVAV